MSFNPLKYQIQATLASEEGDTVQLQLKWGAKEAIVAYPKILLPPELKRGEEFLLRIEPKEARNQMELEIMKELLKELIA